MTDQPNTIDVAADAIARRYFPTGMTVSIMEDAKAAIEADRAELARQDYAIVKVGTVPEWMEQVGWIGVDGRASTDIRMFSQNYPGKRIYRMKKENKNERR